MKQKIKAYSFVKVVDKLPQYMSHFECGFDAIVKGSYSERYGGTNFNSYSLAVLKAGKIVNEISWYDYEHLIVNNEQDYDKAKMLMEQYY